MKCNVCHKQIHHTKWEKGTGMCRICYNKINQEGYTTKDELKAKKIADRNKKELKEYLEAVSIEKSRKQAEFDKELAEVKKESWFKRLFHK